MQPVRFAFFPKVSGGAGHSDDESVVFWGEDGELLHLATILESLPHVSEVWLESTPVFDVTAATRLRLVLGSPLGLTRVSQSEFEWRLSSDSAALFARIVRDLAGHVGHFNYLDNDTLREAGIDPGLEIGQDVEVIVSSGTVPQW